MKKATEQSQSAAKRRFYKWHRIIGLTALVPVIFWTISGLSHPFMSNWFRPSNPVEVYKQPTQAQLKPVLTIQQVLAQNHISQLRNFSLVGFNKTAYYQVLGIDSVYNYYSAQTGRILPDGDQQYAIYLARYFTQDSTSAIKSISLQKTFDGQYQPINHLLPVWKVALNRADGMDVYIETSQSRMGTFNNTTRKTMLWVFEQLHTWQFLEVFGHTFRLVFMLILVSAMFLALLSGLTVYGLFWKNFKAVAQKRKDKGTEDKRFVHRYHRQIGLIISFILFMFIVSGGFHLAIQLREGKAEKPQYQQVVNNSELVLANLHLPLADSLIKRIALAKFNNHTYYQVTNTRKQIIYFDAATGQELVNGDELYATLLGNYYTDGTVHGKPAISRVGQFDNDYGFINKRLPVQKLSYPDGQNWYIETTSAKLATKVAGIDRAEGLSFIFLHKFFWMTWAGKDIRDIVSMLAALTVLATSLLGLSAFIKNK